MLMGARYYDPQTGQFLTRDPLTPMTRQPYLYTSGDPINFTDPSGLQCTTDISPPGPSGDSVDDISETDFLVANATPFGSEPSAQRPLPQSGGGGEQGSSTNNPFWIRAPSKAIAPPASSRGSRGSRGCLYPGIVPTVLPGGGGRPAANTTVLQGAYWDLQSP